MADTPPLEVRCSFYRRTKVSDTPTYQYDHITVDGYDPGAHYLTHPPLVGDSVYLNHRPSPGDEDLTGGYVVIARSWTFTEYGSADWPRGEQYPNEEPLMDVIVEAGEGPFIGQIGDDDDG